MNITNNKNYIIGDNGDNRRLDFMESVGFVMLTFLTAFLLLWSTCTVSDYYKSKVDINLDSKSEMCYKLRHNKITESQIINIVQNRPYDDNYDVLEKGIIDVGTFEAIEEKLR